MLIIRYSNIVFNFDHFDVIMFIKHYRKISSISYDFVS